MLIANAVEGVKNGYTKNLELVGVGYRARMEGTSLVLNLGLNHPVKFDSPEGITVEVPEETKIIVSGIDKQKVGEHAARIREVRKPEPYKGKGIRYEGEYVRRKSAKAAVAEK
jgi:large subunit ribosomal protein L6